MTTLVTDGFDNEKHEPYERIGDGVATGTAYIVYGSNTFLDDLDEDIVHRLEMVGAVNFVREERYPGGRTRLYVSVAGKAPVKP